MNERKEEDEEEEEEGEEGDWVVGVVGKEGGGCLSSLEMALSLAGLVSSGGGGTGLR